MLHFFHSIILSIFFFNVSIMFKNICKCLIKGTGKYNINTEWILTRGKNGPKVHTWGGAEFDLKDTTDVY